MSFCFTVTRQANVNTKGNSYIKIFFMSLFTGIRRVGTSENLYGLWYFMLKMWHAALFGTASTRSQAGTVGYALGKQRGMFNILLTRVGEACQGVEQLYLGNVRFFFFFV